MDVRTFSFPPVLVGILLGSHVQAQPLGGGGLVLGVSLSGEFLNFSSEDSGELIGFCHVFFFCCFLSEMSRPVFFDQQ